MEFEGNATIRLFDLYVGCGDGNLKDFVRVEAFDFICIGELKEAKLKEVEKEKRKDDLTRVSRKKVL